jgi:hypothetical protein
LNTSLTIIVACAILHNIAIDDNQYEVDDEEGYETEDEMIGQDSGSTDGHSYRNRIINDFF